MSVGHFTQQLKREPKAVVAKRSACHNALRAAAQAYLAIDNQLRIMPETASAGRYDQLIRERDAAAVKMQPLLAALGA